MNIIVRKKSVYISSANVLLVQVEHCDLRIILEDHAGNDFVAYLNEKIAEMQEQGLIDQYVAEAQTLAGIE